jgi:hypothetical protein
VSPLQAVLRSSIPKVQLKVVPKQPDLNPNLPKRQKSPPRSSKLFNKFDKMDWEEINTYLHGVYPISKPGVICLKNFKVARAVIDYDELVEIDEKNDPEMFLVKTWIKKLYQAIIDCSTSDTENEEEEEEDM